MDHAEFDDILTRAANPCFIPGVSSYCDRRCERCAFTTRCFSHSEKRREAHRGEALDASVDPAARVADRMRHSLNRAVAVMQVIARREGIDLSADTNQEALAQENARYRKNCADPLVARGRAYAMTAWPIVQALRPIVAEHGDARVVAAVEAIEWLCGPVASKIFRAVQGTNDPWQNAAGLQSDANGSAKVARLAIAESRSAWQVLMEAGRATANGMPAKLVQMLEALDASVAERFPRAMEFVRPGFDTGG
jgi:hypothetical protein